MKNSKKIIALIAIFMVISGALGYYTIVQARKQEVVEYLSQRFHAANLPVTDIEVIELSPLQIQIVVQSLGDFITPEDSINLHKVDREVFIVARQNGYKIERYTRILQDSNGKQLYKLDHGVADIQQAIEGMIAPEISENDAQKILTEKINLLAEQYDIQKAKTKIDVSSFGEARFLEIQFIVSSIDEAYRIFGLLSNLFIYPTDRLIADLNDQGGNIAMCSYKIIDNNNTTLFFYFFDYQLQRGTWSSAENFEVDLGVSDPPSAP